MPCFCDCDVVRFARVIDTFAPFRGDAERSRGVHHGLSTA